MDTHLPLSRRHVNLRFSRLKHVPIRDDNLAHKHGVVRYVDDVDRVRCLVCRVEIVRHSRLGRRFEIV